MDLAEANPEAIPNRNRTNFPSAIALYGGSALLSILIMIFSLSLWHADLSVPFDYTPDGHDAFINMMLVKSVIETGWTWHNPRLGAPGTLDELDFPIPEAMQDAAMLGLSFFTHNFGLVLNLYFLLTFPLIAVTTVLAARQIGLGVATSILIAQLFTFLPFHFWRGEMHLALGGYYALPLIVPSILAIAMGESVVGRKRITAFIGFAMVAVSGPYYASFAGFFLLVAAVASIVRFHDRALLKTAAMLMAVLCGVFFVQILPNLIYTARSGANPAVMLRGPNEGDLYALHIAQLFLPVAGHRIPALANLRAWFAIQAPLINENEAATLGIVGTIGLMILLFRVVFRPPIRHPRSPWERTLDTLAMLLIAGILLATVGGFGPTLNYFGFSMIRAYNRISVFLGLFSLLAIGILIERAIANWFPGKPWHGAGVCCLILAGGLFDQVSPQFVPTYDQNARDFASDAHFVSAIEAAMPAGASIFELPLMSYPESPTLNDLGDYQLFRGYLHSSKLRWSYGAMKGRPVSQWQRSVFALPLQMSMAEIRAKGFSGIYLDRRGYSNDAAEKALKSLFGPPMVSADGHLIFFDITHPVRSQ